MTRVALLRHGHTAWNRAGRIQGRSDIPLDPGAEVEHDDLCLPPPWNEAQLCSSPLRRARQTAQRVGGRDPEIIDALIEMNWGDWEGGHGTDLIADPASGYRHIEDWGWSFRPPGGESPEEVWARLAPWLETLTEDTVAVCHIGVMRILLAKATGWDFDGPAPFRIKRRRLYMLTVRGTDLTRNGDPIRLIPSGDE